MKAFVSLHTEEPKTQIDNEVSYEGYVRAEIDYFTNFALKPLEIIFPEVTESQGGSVKYVVIGSEEEGTGVVHKTVHFMPHIPLIAGDRPKIVFCDILTFPENINPIARVAYELVYRGYTKAEEWHPALYEVINTELERVGMPVIPAVRSGTAHMVQCFDSLMELGLTMGSA